ncbi:hypothetical protein RYX36_000023, partial [Vicia faba]
HLIPNLDSHRGKSKNRSISNCYTTEGVNEVMESRGGKKKSSSSSKSSLYEAPLDYIIEDVRPNGGVEKFKSPDYSNCTRKPS